MSGARIAPGSRHDVGLANWLLSQGAGLVAGTAAPNLFLTLARNRGLFRGWLHFAGRLMPRGKLPRRDTELVILRVAHLRSCSYEFDHHVRLARRAGVTVADVERVVKGPEEPGWTNREQAILSAVDELHKHGDISNPVWKELRSYLDERGCIELCLLVGHYEMLATTVAALRIETDAPRGRLSLRRAPQ